VINDIFIQKMPLMYYAVVDKINVEFQNSIEWFRYVEEAVCLLFNLKLSNLQQPE
jgi:hypothetical protein